MIGVLLGLGVLVIIGALGLVCVLAAAETTRREESQDSDNRP